MLPMRWEPRTALHQMREEMDRAFDSFFSRSPLSRWWSENRGFGDLGPSIDVYETDTEVVIKAEVPGVARDDLDVRVANDSVTLTGELRREDEVNEDGYHRRERCFGRFTRTVSLPSPCKTEGADASYRDGVLTIRLTKEQEGTKTKRVEIH
ncbi:MAG TPA: Hsp20/alpha crystallin family protein [Armatimonadota bacterium]|nr:Hsp20/alpha crystallin family protein [Armatimonadota bacterium]